MGFAHELVGWGEHNMHLTRRMNGSFVGALMVAGVMLIGCSTFRGGAPGVPADVPSPGAPSTAVSAPSSTSPTPSALRSMDAATTACSALLDEDLLQAMLVVQSGQATLAAAYEATGDQLATYLETTSPEGEGVSPSVWRDQPTKVVYMCLIDGDLFTQTPGPPEADRSAVRVLVVIADGEAHLWRIARKDRSAVPTTDPATMAQ